MALCLSLLATAGVKAQQARPDKALYICFDLSVSPGNQAVIGQAVPGFGELQQTYGFTLQKSTSLSDETLTRLEQQALANSGSSESVTQLRNLYKVVLKEPTAEKLNTVAGALKQLPHVKYCSLMQLGAIAPPADIAPVTASFETQQGYLAPNPGVDMRYAWSQGFTGQGIRISDVEYGFNKNHEEFVDNANVHFAQGLQTDTSLPLDFPEHGTAVLGIVYADSGAYGVSGMAHGAREMVQYPEFSMALGHDRVGAISQAIADSKTGDVIIYEMQTYGFDDQPGDEKFVPAEYEQPVWTVTKAATDAGLIVVAAAGNGSQDLDHANYADYMSWGNSGAIIVGAGLPTFAHSRSSFSTYGSRVDVQGWGSNVYTSGYGDIMMIGNDYNQTYTRFSGTSSATPVVASCVAVLQGYYHSLTNKYLTAAQMKDVLKQTGVAQGSPHTGHIGPLPNMKAAMQYLSATLGVAATPGKPVIAIYPNPFSNTIHLVNGKGAGNTEVQVFNTLGQLVYHTTMEQNATINTSSWQSGMYMATLRNSRGAVTERLVKP
jgi:subtilisin family serine protease